MNELIGWLKEQNEGVGTYFGLQERAYGLTLSNPDQAALLRLLGVLAARIAASYDDMPLPANIARSTFERVTSLTEKALGAMDDTAQEKLAILNEIARTELG